MERANYIVLNYLAYLQQNNQVADKEQLDVAINILQEVLGVSSVQQSAELIALLEQASGTQQMSSEQLKNDGNAAMKEKKYERARDCYTSAINNSLRYGEALELRSVYFANRAMALHEMGDHKAALADCQESVRLNPGYVKGQLRYAQYLEEDGYMQAAGDIYYRLSDSEPSNYQYRDGLARTRAAAQPGVEGAQDVQGLFGALGGLKNDPEMQQLMKNPKMAQLAAQIQQNPMAAMSALYDPELAPMVKKLLGKISPQLAGMLDGMGGMGGMFGPQ